MKKNLLLLVFSLAFCVCQGQEWFTSFDVAKRIALIQNKMLFVVWEDSFDYSSPVFIKNEKGQISVIDLSIDTSFDSIIREYFVPVKLSELYYEDFIKKAKGKSFKYTNRLNDDSVKIMDVNGNIVNISDDPVEILNLSLLIKKYALDTSFLKTELENYLKERNFITSFRLGAKYIDFSILTGKEIRPEIIALADIYLEESKRFLQDNVSENIAANLQKIVLLQIKEDLILDQPRKAKRQIKRMDSTQIDPINESLFAMLNYIVFKSMNDEMNAELWKSKISSLDLQKAELILKNNRNGSAN